MDRDVLMNQREDRFREEFAKALQAPEDVPDGQWIEAGEMAFRDAALTVVPPVYSVLVVSKALTALLLVALLRTLAASQQPGRPVE